MDLEDIKVALGPDTKWDAYESSLSRSFKFDTNKESHKFVGEVGKISSEFRNKSDIFIYDDNTVKIMLTTEAVNDVTPMDIEISRKIDNVYEEMLAARG